MVNGNFDYFYDGTNLHLNLIEDKEKNSVPGSMEINNALIKLDKNNHLTGAYCPATPSN